MNLSEENLDKTCRTCLMQDDKRKFSLYDKIVIGPGNDAKLSIHDLLVDVSKVKIEMVKNNAKLPTNICINCIQLLKWVLDFREQCKKSESILSCYSIKIKESSNSIMQNEDVKHIKIEPEVEVESLTSVLDIKPENEDDAEVLVKHSLNVAKSKEKTRYKCLVCKQIFMRRGTYEKHMNKHKTENRKCHLCNKTFRYGKVLVAHIAAKHKNMQDTVAIKNETETEIPNLTEESNAPTSSGTVPESADFAMPKKPYKCPVCMQKFVSQDGLEKHREKHKDENVTCDLCHKTFRHAGRLAVHKRTHKETKKPYKCQVCGKTYKRRATVNNHMRLHTGERPYLCPACGKNFMNISDLRYHLRIHSKERQYMCNICGKTMYMQSHLVQHMRTHSGERPYKCGACDKAFISSQTLKNHEIIHTGLKPYACDVCNKSFNRRTNMQLHRKIHTWDLSKQTD